MEGSAGQGENAVIGEVRSGSPAAVPSIDGLAGALRQHGYVASRSLTVALRLAIALGKPLLVEGDPGVGKTDLARALAAAQGARLIRLQCYEGLEAAQALYEWNYGRQLLHIRAAEATGSDMNSVEQDLFTEEFLIRRPLLQAIAEPAQTPPVLLIDEVDRSDAPFEALLLELLSDFQVSVPELGTVRAIHRPTVILTSNRTREIHDALRRRCLYLWLDFPSPEAEAEVIKLRTPGISNRLVEQICAFLQRLRAENLRKVPGTAESLEWAASLVLLGVDQLDFDSVWDTRSALLKSQDDQARVDALVIAALLCPGDPRPPAAHRPT